MDNLSSFAKLPLILAIKRLSLLFKLTHLLPFFSSSFLSEGMLCACYGSVYVCITIHRILDVKKRKNSHKSESVTIRLLQQPHS